MLKISQVSLLSQREVLELNHSEVNRTVLSEEDEEQMDVDPTLYGPSLWDRRQESMTEEVMRVASRGLSVHGRSNGAASVWTDEATLRSVELGPLNEKVGKPR